MYFSELGNYVPKQSATNEEMRSCPFSDLSKSEDELGDELYKDQNGIQHNHYLGYYLANYAGHVAAGDYHIHGSSGGFASWILSNLLEKGLVNAVAQVKPNPLYNTRDPQSPMFSYAFSSTVEEVRQGAKSRYYPVEISGIISHILKTNGRYAIIALPCMVKAIRSLQNEYPLLNERISFVGSLVCGHLKSKYYAEFLAWDNGIRKEQLLEVNFREKLKERSASDYGTTF